MTSENIKTRPGSIPGNTAGPKTQIIQQIQSSDQADLASTCSNERRTCANSDPDLTQARSLAVHLTQIRGMIRRLPEGVEKQRLQLLAWQMRDRPPAEFMQRQIQVMAAGRVQH